MKQEHQIKKMLKKIKHIINSSNSDVKLRNVKVAKKTLEWVLS